MQQNEQQVHRDFSPTPILRCNGMWPGPTIVASRSQPIKVHRAAAGTFIVRMGKRLFFFGFK
ncbi:hypothetical protein [Paenibacillus sp. MMO-177]|uniref:hypothetical protein n=1 Tax=Paenibacillus sp. MMO-177 TaxID=3081289 RepID=UPI00301A02A5